MALFCFNASTKSSLADTDCPPGRPFFPSQNGTWLKNVMINGAKMMKMKLRVGTQPIPSSLSNLAGSTTTVTIKMTITKAKMPAG
tara:strand:- start:7 stop:261 length:255 start_codon:yes stop_codon:yes gene_type:complete